MKPDPVVRPTKPRHIWVLGLGHGEMARMPGLLLGWRQRAGEKRWQAWVIYVEPDGSMRQSWIDRRSVEPASGPETVGGPA